MKNFIQIFLMTILGIAFLLTSCKGNGRSESEYEVVDEIAIEEDYSEPAWQYEVITSSYTDVNGGEHKYVVGVALKIGNDYVAFDNFTDYTAIVKPLLIALEISISYAFNSTYPSESDRRYVESGFPSESDWRHFESEILSYIKDDNPDWTVIPDTRLRKFAGDFYGEIRRYIPTLDEEGADWKKYRCAKSYLYIKAATEDDEKDLGVPKGALIAKRRL